MVTFFLPDAPEGTGRERGGSDRAGWNIYKPLWDARPRNLTPVGGEPRLPATVREALRARLAEEAEIPDIGGNVYPSASGAGLPQM